MNNLVVEVKKNKNKTNKKNNPVIISIKLGH
jgi:hypothetical protein